MRLGYWIYFEKPGEKQKLCQIMNDNFEEYKQLEAIQKEFNLDILTASRVIETYNSSIKK